MMMLGILVYAQDTLSNKSSTPLNSGSSTPLNKGTSSTSSANGTGATLNNNNPNPSGNSNNGTSTNSNTIPRRNDTVPLNNGGNPVIAPATANPNGGTTSPHNGNASNAQERTTETNTKGGFKNDTIPGQHQSSSNDSSGYNTNMSAPATGDSTSFNSGNNNNNNSGIANNRDSSNNGRVKKNQQDNDAATASSNHEAKETTATNTTTLTDRVIMKEDKMFLIKNGESNPMEKNYKLASGAVVMTTGTVKYPGGRIVKLKNGQFIEISQKDKDAQAAKTTTVSKTNKKKTVTKTKITRTQ